MKPEYVFAVCEGNELRLPAELFHTFQEACILAGHKSRATQRTYSVFPLKTPDWHGICGNCGKAWIPGQVEPTETKGASA